MVKVTEQDIFSILSGKISGLISRAFFKGFSSEGIDITPEQWSILSCLWENDKVIQQVICDLTEKDKPSVTRLINKLEKKELVKRVSDPSDGRNNLIHLTPKGIALKQKTTDIVHEIVNHSLEGISDSELSIAKNVLLQIMWNLKSYG